PLQRQWRSAGSGSETSKRPKDGWVAVPLKRVGGVLVVTARINDLITTNFIVDTGADTVTISHRLANQLGLEYESQPKRLVRTASGFMTSPLIVLGSVHVPAEGGAAVEGVEALVSTLPGSTRAIDGLLGQSFLRHFHVTIDAQREVMHLRPIRP